MKIVIVGGVAGGATAAARLRRISEKYQIVMFEKDEYISYANCGLPYYIGDVISDKQKLQVQTVEGMSKRFNIDIRTNSQVLKVDTVNKTVLVKDLKTDKEYSESFDKIILSCGAKPIRPNIAGLDAANNVFTLRNIPDTYKIKEYINENNVKHAVVIGGGFIGVEMAENLRHLNVDVALVEKQSQVLRILDYEMAQLVHNELYQNGIELILNDGISRFEENGKAVVLESGTVIPTDMTILAIGVVPENQLALNAGIKIGPKGHLVTDQNFNVFSGDGKLLPDIYAVGDMIEVINPLDDTKYAVPLAWGANRQGRLVADAISGQKVKTSKILGANILKVFDLNAASVGASESALKEKNIEYEAIHAVRANHATYYPGSQNIYLKMLFDKKTGQIFGAQAVGGEGVDKRIDVISTVMRLNGTAFDLSDIEVCYAPPFSSAKDPVNILGYIAENVASGTYKIVRHDQIDKIAASGAALLDVRTPFEFNLGHIKGAVNIEVDSLRDNLDKLNFDKNAPVYVNCQSGLRSYLAINILRSNGYTNLYNLSGGYLTYKTFNHKHDNLKKAHVAIDDMQQGLKEPQIKTIDCTGMQCPGPLMATFKALSTLAEGEKIAVTTKDFGFEQDIENWTQTNNHTLVSLDKTNGVVSAVIQKGKGKNCVAELTQKNATIVVFSGDLDKVLASMIIAQGAAAQDKDVTMFFTFWGLNALRRSKKVRVKKTFIEKMFGKMMPRGATKLKLSNMNMGGMGAKMIKGIMKKKNVDSLPEMIKNAQAAGVKMVACTMSMDLMGIKAQELIDGVEFAGVATYISKNENVGTTLFI